MSKNSDSLTFAPVDFERDTLADGLTAVGFDPTQQTFFTWLGVVAYLTERPVFSTLGFFVSLPGGAHVVFDYGNPSPLGPDHPVSARFSTRLGARQLDRRLHLAHQQTSC